MREQLPAPDSPVPAGEDQLHTSIFRYKHAIGFTPRTDLEAIGGWLRLLMMTGHLARLTGAQLKLLCVLAADTNGKKWQERTIMFSWPGEVVWATKAGVRGGHFYESIRELVKAGLVERLTEQIDGEEKDGWVVISPERAPAPARPTETVKHFRKKKVRKFRGIEGRHYARAAGSARNEPTPRALPAVVGARHGQRAQNAESTLDNARACAPAQKSETPKSSTTNNTTTTGGADAGKSADFDVVVVELGKQGIGKKVARELASKPTTTRLLATAAALQAATRPEEHRSGKLVELLREPDLIAQKFIDQAESKLVRPAPKPIEPGTPPDVETQKRGAQLLREALAKAKAGEA